MRIMNMMIGTMMPKSTEKMYNVVQRVKANGGKLPEDLESVGGK